MIARDNDTRAAFNGAARELWRALGLLGEESTYGSAEVAVGDRVICRRNDRLIDVDNGMRGTVRHVDGDRVVIDTDSGLVRELPGAYVSEHLEHAYSLTGHGMQGGTVETALVVASPRDLTAGWSYTALSRARGETRLLIHDHQPTEGRGEFAPSEQTPTLARSDLLACVQRHMLERDDEDLAIEQLAGAGRADDPEVAGSRALASEPPQERGAARAEPAPPSAATRAQLCELRERIERLQAQLQALPTRRLQHIEHYDERTLTLLTQRERHAERLAALPEPHRRFGREHDSHASERRQSANKPRSATSSSSASCTHPEHGCETPPVSAPMSSGRVRCGRAACGGSRSTARSMGSATQATRWDRGRRGVSSARMGTALARQSSAQGGDSGVTSASSTRRTSASGSEKISNLLRASAALWAAYTFAVACRHYRWPMPSSLCGICND